MEWSKSISQAISYIEENITEDLAIEEIARKACISPYYFQKGFTLLCGFTVGEYIRKRRLTLAGSELVATPHKIIDIALKYGYDSPDSFTKAFTRFHGATPTAVRKGEAMIKSFAPLKIKLILEGGFSVDYKISKKEAFTLIGMSNIFKYEEAALAIPASWQAFYQSAGQSGVHSKYGVSIDEKMCGDQFEYMIGDDYQPTMEIPEGFTTKVIPEHTWAIFACKGPGPQTIPEVHQKIFSEWLPGCRDYEIASGYHIEMYENPEDYPRGIQDENYYCEIWIPVKKK